MWLQGLWGTSDCVGPGTVGLVRLCGTRDGGTSETVWDQWLCDGGLADKDDRPWLDRYMRWCMCGCTGGTVESHSELDEVSPTTKGFHDIPAQAERE